MLTSLRTRAGWVRRFRPEQGLRPERRRDPCALLSLHSRHASHRDADAPSRAVNARRTLLPGDGSSSHTHTGPHSRLSFKRGGASRTGQADQQSSVTPVLVHVTQQVEVHDEVEEKERDQRTLGELPPLGVQVGGAVPYAVRFERARENEGGEVELGRKGESM